jgi:hypothetical protein
MGILQDSLQVVKTVSRLTNPELLERVTALNEQVLELSSKNVELQELVFGLEKELQQATEKLNLIGQVQRTDGFVYHKAEPDPCCSHCFDSEQILIRVVEARDPTAPTGSSPYCPHCKTRFGGFRPRGLRSKVIS